jgi:hypothetical protein
MRRVCLLSFSVAAIGKVSAANSRTVTIAVSQLKGTTCLPPPGLASQTAVRLIPDIEVSSTKIVSGPYRAAVA